MSFFDDPPLRDFPGHALRRLLENPANLRDLVTALRPDLAAHMDFDHVEIEPREFLMEDWRKRECDLFFRVPYRTDEGASTILICLLVEQQSSPDPRMPLRTLLYSVVFWEREWRAWEDRHDFRQPLRLTPVLPIVFYTGSTPWNASREMADLFAGPQELRPFAPQWPMLFWDLSTQDPATLLSSASAWLQALAVVRTEGEELATFEAAFRQVCESLDHLKSSQRMRALDLLWFVLSWGMKRRPGRERQHLREIAIESASEPPAKEEVEQMSKLIGETWEEELRRDERVRTNRMTLRHILRTILEDHFGTLPAAILEQIAACEDADRLTEWTKKAARVNSLDELRLE